MTETVEFNKEEFVPSYIKAIQDNDLIAQIDLVTKLKVEDRAGALKALIDTIEADEELAKDIADALGELKAIEGTNVLIDALDETNAAADVEVAAPSIVQSEPKEEA